MKNYLWKNLIVFICLISTLLLQGFSCYAAASGADTFVVSEDIENAITDIDNADLEKENVITETESTETEDVITEAESAEMEDVADETESAETEDVADETESADAEDITVETENIKAEDADTENDLAEVDNASMEGSFSLVVTEEEIVAIEQPTISEYGVQPFDYIIDPQRLITATNGIKYGNISFEEGSTLYFRNMEGSYDYSSRSDQLTITSQSTVPVKITLTASLQNLDHIFLTNDPDFKGDSRNSLYFALVDDKGNMVPLSERGEVKISYEMGEISEDEAIEGTGEEQYSFGLMGACNPNGSWEYITELPQVVVTWEVEPIINNEEIISEDSVSDNTISMDSVSDNSISMNSVSDNSISMNSVSDNSISMNGVSDNSISMNGVSDNSISMNGVSDNSISMNGISDNSISMNGVSDNSISMNGVSDNSISMNGVSDNSISMNGVSDNSISENGEVLPSGEQNVENDIIEEAGADIQESADEVSDKVISENNVTDDNIETEDSGNADIAEAESALTEDSVPTDIDDTMDAADAAAETETVLTEDSSNVDAEEAVTAETVAAADGSGNASGDDAGITGSDMSSQASMETVAVLSDSSASVQTTMTNIQVESGTCY